jgi:23S rRNA (adenine-N6)-dimethyltransferase
MHSNDKKHRKVRKVISGPNFSGQHLLRSPRVIRKMIDKAGIRPGDIVLDLGAGKGALAFAMAEKAERVIAVENDPRFADILRNKAQAFANVAVVERNILHLHWPKRPFRVVASIPYSITTPIMVKLLDSPCDHLHCAVLLIEYGAAKRFTSRHVRDPRLLGWRMRFDLEWIEAVPRDHFSPPPSVDSAIFRIRRKAEPLVAPRHSRLFAGLAEYALKHPDAPVGVALKGVFTAPQLAHLCRNLGVRPQAPVCTLTEEQWGETFRTMIERVPPYRWPRPRR